MHFRDRRGRVWVTLLVAIVSMVATLATARAASPTSIAIPSPVAGGWQLNGTAQLNTSASPPNLELTAATNWQAGSAFWPTPVPGAGITATFDAFIGSGSGADGLTFTLADASATQSTALGVNGGGEGYSGIKGIAVSMDTWQNAVNPSNNFVGIATGAGPAANELNYVTTNTSIQPLRNTVHHFVVTTTSAGITVTMDGTQVLTYATSLPANVLVGFTGGTGGFNDIHQVQNVSITAASPPTPTVTAVNPSSGPSTGGTSVTITGTSFTTVSAVDFGGTAATTFEVNSANTITASTPPGTLGVDDVTVTTSGGTSATNPSDQFTYTTGPPPGSIPSPVAGGWQVNGSAQLNATASPANLELTAATNWQAGSAFWPTPVSGVGITAAFDAFIGSGSGADGLTFTLADASVTKPTAVGNNGGGEGYSGIKGIAVSLDTYKNSVNPSSNFVGIANGAGPSAASLNYVSTNSSIPSLRNAMHHFVVTTSSTGITVVMDGTQVLNYATAVPASVLVGFTGGTGGLNDVHQVQNVSITTGPPPPVPTVTGISPASGPSTGGTSVTITGTNFTGASAVNFGPSNQSSMFTVNNPTTITAASPSGTGAVDVTVTTPGGTSATNAGDRFTYTPPPAPTVTGVSPTSGPSAGGTSVTVTGTNFAGVSAVDFGPGNPATTMTVNNSTTVIATAPAGTGTIDVTVTTPGGTSATSAADHYTYIAAPPPAPTVTRVNPTSGPSTGGTSVTVTGTNFTGANAVDFGGSPATYTVNNSTTLIATAPAGTGTVDVTVTVAGVTSATGTADRYTYVAAPPPPAPTVTSVNPTSGPSTGGTSVTITGTNFTGANAVDFGGTAATTFEVNSANTITATSPSGTLGAVDVTVTTGGGTSATNSGDKFTYLSGPPPGSIPSPVSGGWQLNGTAQLNASGSPPNLQLTTTTNWQAGSAFWPTPVPGVGITAAFDAFIGSGSGADGLTFTLADASVTKPTALGVNGGGEGYSGIKGIAVSMDTWQNAVNPSSNFVGIATGAGPAADELNYVTTNTSIPSLRNTVHHFVVTTTSTGITVTMDGTQVLTYATTVPASVLVGFSGGTGGFNDIHQVQNVSITGAPPPPAPTVTGVSPTSGPSTGGTSITITGTNFTGASAVNFGPSNPSPTIAVISSTTMTASAPAGTGTVDVTVTTPGGTSATSTADQFTYAPPPAPTVTGVSPTTGPGTGGTSVTITGTNFSGVSAVDFGAGNPVKTMTVNSSTTITVTTPGGIGTVDVTVTTPGGTSATSLADHYAYSPGAQSPPAVTAVNPPSGPVGTLVTVSGTSFTGATAVDFGGTATTFTVNGATTITAVAPAGTGTIDVTVTTGEGTSTTSSADRYTYTAGPPPGTVPSPVAGGWQLNGSAQLNPSASPPNLQLTTTTNWQAGSAFWPTPVPGVGITAAFDAFLGSGSGADGLTLTLADATATTPTALGDNGGGEGFSGLAGIAVSMDTWQDTGYPSNNFVGVATTSTPMQSLNYVATDTSIPSLRNTLHHFVVTTTSTGITVTMDGTQVLSYATSLPNYVLIGFTGGTGGFNDVHEVQNVAITSGPPLPAPTVTSVDPSSGPSTAGTIVSITGSGFTGTGLLGVRAVHFGTTAATAMTINSSTILTATAPAGTGTVDVTVTTGAGTSATSPADQFTYIVPPVPTVTGLSPTSGPSTGGTTVNVTGTGFTFATTVDFGTTAAKFTVSNDNQLTVTVPAGNLGTVDVTVATATGTSTTSSADQYTYVVPPVPTVTGMSPTSGPSTGGTTVNVTGTGFTGASAVNFGPSDPAITYAVNSPTSITATSPPGPIGTFDITVITPGGTSPTSAADQFTYSVPPAPTVTAVSPSSGPNSTLVTVTGTNFTGATSTNFGITGATFTVSSATTIYATVPAGTGTVDVTVVTPGGTSATGPVDQYTYTLPPPPTVTGLSPTSGFEGTYVIVTGTNFTGTSAVDFGTTPTTFSVTSATSITANAPGASGTVDVTVTTSGGTSATGAADQFTYQAGPAPPTMVATYRGGLERSGYYPSETGLTAANVATLKLHWTDTGGTGSFAQPIVANNMVYWGDWNGVEHATTLSGQDVWTANLGVNTDSACLPPVAGVSGTATIGMLGTTSVLFVPGGSDNFYALNALTGAVMWQTNLGTPPGDYLWSSPILYNGSIYQGVASFGDCPLVQGQLVQMNASTGAIQHIADMVPNGCIGGGIWSSPAIDPSDGSIYVTTGTPNGCGLPELAPAIVKLRASDLTILSSWTIPQSQLYSDPDFGTTPTLFTAVINGVSRSLIGALDKNGLFYAWDTTNLAAGPVWETRIANPAGGPLSIVSATWDGTRLYVGGGNTIINGNSCYENISALNPATGAFDWRACVQGSMTAAITEVPGMLIEGYGAVGRLLFLNPTNGATLLNYSPGGWPEGEVTVSNGIVYVPLTNGNLIALGQ